MSNNNKKSNKNLNKSIIKSYFDKENLFELFGEDDPVTLEGELYRFKPGIENNFISRWVQVSGRAFRYFRNNYQSLGLSRPIVAFPKKAIEDICKIDIEKESFFKKTHMKDNEKELFSHMFEIYLREDYEDIYHYREEE